MGMDSAGPLLVHLTNATQRNRALPPSEASLESSKTSEPEARRTESHRAPEVEARKTHDGLKEVSNASENQPAVNERREDEDKFDVEMPEHQESGCSSPLTGSTPYGLTSPRKLESSAVAINERREESSAASINERREDEDEEEMFGRKFSTCSCPPTCESKSPRKTQAITLEPIAVRCHTQDGDSFHSGTSPTCAASALLSRRRLTHNTIEVHLGEEAFNHKASGSSQRSSPCLSPAISVDGTTWTRGFSPESPASPVSPMSPASPASRLFERRRRRFVTTPLTLNSSMNPATLQIDTVAATVEELQLPDGESLVKSDGMKFSDIYDAIEVVGQGTTGVVYRARHKNDDRHVVALKTLRTSDEEMIRIARREYEILSTIRHENIIRAFDFFVATDRVVLVLEFFDGLSLNKALQANPGKTLTECVSYFLFLKLLQAIAHLHQQRIIHRDVKAENVLVSKDFKDLRLIDFNTAKRLAEGGALTVTGTRLYAAPEVLLGDSPSEGSDVWSLGLCLHMMLSGQLPAQLRRPVESYNAFVRKVIEEPFDLHGRRWQHVSDPCKACLRRCLEKRRNLRPAAMTLLEDDWVREGPDSRSSKRALSPRRKTTCGLGRRHSGSFPPFTVLPRRQSRRRKRAKSY